MSYYRFSEAFSRIIKILFGVVTLLGFFYKCTADGWTQVNVQPSSGGGGGYVEVRNTSPSTTGGSAGTGITSNGNVGETKKIIISKNKYNGKSNGGASVYGGYGRGASIEIYSGTKPSVYSASTSGYVKVTFIN